MWQRWAPYLWVVAGFASLALLGGQRSGKAPNVVAVILLALVWVSALVARRAASEPLLRKQSVVAMVATGLLLLAVALAMRP